MALFLFTNSNWYRASNNFTGNSGHYQFCDDQPGVDGKGEEGNTQDDGLRCSIKPRPLPCLLLHTESPLDAIFGVVLLLI